MAVWRQPIVVFVSVPLIAGTLLLTAVSGSMTAAANTTSPEPLPPRIGAASRVDTAAIIRTGTQTQPAMARTRQPDAIASGNVASEIYTASSSAAVTTSNNWSGYVVGPGPYTAVTGTFNVPNLAAAPIETFTAEWVGIDGEGDSSLIQAGVTEVYEPSTNLVYTSAAWGGGAWWEILPAPWTPVTTMAVKPGDSVTVTISQVSATVWDITLTDNTTGHGFTTQQAYSGPQTSAEWIVEAPTKGRTQTTLGQYSPVVTFTGVRMSGPQTTLTAVNMVQGGVTVAVPSALTTDGFSVAYVAARAPTSVPSPTSTPAPILTPVPTPPPTPTTPPTGLAQARTVLVGGNEVGAGFTITDHDYTFAERAAATSSPPPPYRSWAEALTAWGWQLGSNRDLFNGSVRTGVYEVVSLANVYSSSGGVAAAYASNLTNLAATTGTPYSTSPLGTGIGDQSAAFTRSTLLPTISGGQFSATEFVIYFRAGRVSNVVTLYSYPNQMDTALAVRLAQQQAIRAALFYPTVTATPIPAPTASPAPTVSPAPPPLPAPTTSVEQRIADFWKRIDASQPADPVAASDLGQWALNVIGRNPRAQLTVIDFRLSTAGMQGGFDRGGLAPVPTAPPAPTTNIEQRIADFWKRIDALQPSDYVSAADVGQWALNVIGRNPRAQLTVADFRASTAGMQGGLDRGGLAAATPAASTDKWVFRTVDVSSQAPIAGICLEVGTRSAPPVGDSGRSSSCGPTLALSDADGYVQFVVPPASQEDAYIFRFEKPGYWPVVIAVDYHHGIGTLTVTIPLSR